MKTQEQIEEALKAIQFACMAASADRNAGAFDFLMAVQSTILWVLDSGDPRTELVQRGINLGMPSRKQEAKS